MEVLTTRCVFFMLFGIVHAKDWEPKIYTRGENATIHIGTVEIDGMAALEITVYGYTSKQHVTNVMLYDPRKIQGDNISISRDYIGRIKRIELNRSSFSFLLLNVDFVDSGNYTVIQDSQKKGATSIFVIRQSLHGNYNEPMILPFTCNITSISSIKIEMMIAKLHFPVVKYDVTQRKCTEEGNLYMHRIESCVLKGNSFSFTIRQVNFFDMGMYVAWDDKDLLMDSVFVEFKENNTTSNPGTIDHIVSSPFIPNLSSSGAEHYMLEIISVSAVTVVLVAACLIINAVGRLQRRRISKTKTNNLSHINARQNIPNSSRNCVQTREIAHTPEVTRTVLTENSASSDLTDFAYNQVQDNVTLNDKNLCAGGLDSTKSVVTKIQRHPSIVPSICETIQSEPTHEYDKMNYNDPLETEFRHDQSCSELYGTNQTENIAENTYNYDYVVQYCSKSLQAHKQDLIITKKAKEEVNITNSFSKYKKVMNTSPISIDPSTLYAKVSQERPGEIPCAGAIADLGSSDLSKTLVSSKFLQIEDCYSVDAIDLPTSSQHIPSKKQRTSQFVTSTVNVPGPESSELQEYINSQSVSQTKYYDFAGPVLDDSSAKKRGHRRSQSCGALYGNMMANFGV